MKRLKKLALSILGVTVLSLGLYACSNDDSVNEEKKSLAKETNKEDLIKELANDSDFVEYVKINISNFENLDYDIDSINLILRDNQIDVEEDSIVHKALGFKTREIYVDNLSLQVKLLHNVQQKINLTKFSTVDFEAAVSIVYDDLDYTILNNCSRTRRNCILVAASVAIAAHIACGTTDLLPAVGMLCHGAALVGHTAMQDQCEVNYLECKKK